ncbi:hypothetical protein PITC_019770 [Penicillium italicum]|uniref:Uncharacterized protein n=1 Tax=Penicillium italicum TaxID=40296 RepID=A0A0A2L2L4_PENIT|nr:hypothetical protein PITC_019770 [Penicillium italicum]
MHLTPNVYCPFCGVILLPDPYSDDDTSLQSRVRPWYAEIRGLYLNNAAAGYITTTGLGVVYGRNILYAPLDSDQSYVDVGFEGLEEWRLFGSSVSRWCFGFHNSCWKLLLLRFAHRPDGVFQNEATISKSVFYQLYCTPCIHASIFQFGHDYDGAAQTHKSFGRPKAVDLSSHFYADPCAIQSPADLESASSGFRKACGTSLSKQRDNTHPATAIAADIDCHSEEGTTSASCPVRHNGNCESIPSHDSMAKQMLENPKRPKHYIFDRLSLELKFEIFSYLSFDELLIVRLVCRDLALLATVDMLPRSYWRSRFLLGQEADFLFLDVTDTLDWYLLFFGIRASLTAGTLPLVNRKRIRQLLEPIAALVGLEAVLKNGPCGSAVQLVESQSGRYQLVDQESAETPSRLIEVADFFSGQLASVGADSPLDEGCRVLYHRTQSFVVPLQPYRQRIGISIIQFGAQSFISGINLFPCRERNVVGLRVGYQNSASERWIEIPKNSHVEALGVAFCSQGLTGIKFIYTGSNSSGWLGDSNGPGIANGTLSIPEGSNWHCLLVGLDRYKIVSLGLGKETDHLETLMSPFRHVTDSSRVQSHLWTPHAPRQEELRISILLPFRSPRAFEPLTNIDFGGPRGLLLASLARLTFYMTSYPYLFIGIEISYSDGRSVLHGSSGGCGLSFFVDGSNGERINRIGVLGIRESQPEMSLDGLQVSTNYGRTATFAPIYHRLNAAVELIPISPSNTITGLVAFEMQFIKQIQTVAEQTQATLTCFERVGIQSQQCDEQPNIPDILECECHQIPDDQLRYDKRFSHFIYSKGSGDYQTYASLKNVRRIQASTGIPGQSRSPSRISGLKLEYHNHPSPGIVGQWMHHLDDGFEISQDEDVQSLTIWLIPTGFSPESPGMEIGQVAAIKIETTRSRSVTFRAPDFQSISPQALQHHQYQADSDEKLTAISWILNISSERVRAVISTNGSRRNPLMLVPEEVPPFDQVRKLYFERQNDDGDRDTIITVEAYLKDRAIVGLVFVYASGKTMSTGELDTEACQTLHFALDARIVGLSVVATDHKLMEIEFEVEKNGQPQSEKLRLSASLPHDPAAAVYYKLRAVWCKDDASAESCRRLLERDRVYKPPSGSRLIGIYMRCQEFYRVGALYEPDVSQ